MSICLIDTSIFVIILGVPRMSDNRDEILTELKEYVELETKLLLPMATILETGNHIAQNGDGRQRRNCAIEFVNQVTEAFAGNAPWQPTSFPSASAIQEWLPEFIACAATNKAPTKPEGTSFGDLTIIKEWEKVCRQNQGHDVFIWSLDADLDQYSRNGI